jgi:hypothetical protein
MSARLPNINCKHYDQVEECCLHWAAPEPSLLRRNTPCLLHSTDVRIACVKREVRYHFPPTSRGPL